LYSTQQLASCSGSFLLADWISQGLSQASLVFSPVSYPQSGSKAALI